MALTKQQLKDIETHLVELAAKEVGPIIKEKAGTLFEAFDDKANQVDLVTAVDKKIEAIIKDSLAKQYPDFKFIGEETFQPGDTAIGKEPTFIIDPIDGTTNFIHGYPYSCTSLGLVENGIPVCGVVFNPHLDMMFHASAGNGAFLNGKPIKVTERDLTLQQSILALEAGSERSSGSSGDDNFDIKQATYKNLLSDQGAYIHGSRSCGSAAMNMCFVAAGKLDAYWEGGCWAWDVCAGWSILTEAGGMVVGGNPNEWKVPVDDRCYLAVRGGCTEPMQKKFVENFWSQVAGKLKYHW
ncbi:LANO_0H10264g1_1 [Lachancea nothofagi CBS 11611]|uniref:Inositol-1-monophosphatase n=1 Tax=Lachancea nothofagi CBS 11611 TaxID=1266666 RepID=A0A1G4KM56_9SACH|nr:LANO_0H10264g1_1 [Lachancea nothofagi CBS 11611]